MQGGGSVDADPDEKSFGMEERAPFVIKQDAVGLEGVFDGLALGIFRLKGHRRAEEIDPEQCRLTALPGKVDGGTGLGGDVVSHIRLQDLGLHPHAPCVGVEFFLLEIEAIAAVQVAP